MSPRAAAEFGKQWPELQRRLRAFLKGKGVQPSEVDDLVQEVAARLVSFWHKVDPDRPLWPLTATIALNLLRDRSRRPELELPGELPDVAGPNDVADAGIARLELEAVVRAMDSLTPSQKAALLQAIHFDDASVPSTSAEKMLRMRARRRLANAIGRACGGVTLKTRRIADSIHGFFSKADAMAQALACATCLFVASAGTVGSAVVYPPLDGYEGDLEVVAPFGASTGSLGAMPIAAPTASMAAERLSPARGTNAHDTRVARERGAGTGKGSSTSAATGSGTPAAGLAVPNTSVVPTDTPVPAPGPPSAPDQPTEAPNLNVESQPPPPTGGSPVQSPTGDAPLGTVEDVTTLVGDATG